MSRLAPSFSGIVIGSRWIERSALDVIWAGGAGICLASVRAALALDGVADSPSTSKNASFSARSVNVATSTIPRSEEHTSELQSRRDLVCRLLLEKKKKKKKSKQT